MNPESAAGWAEHLTNPYALAGFIILVVISIGLLFKTLPSAKLKSNETYKLLRLLIVGGMVLGGIAIALAFFQDFLKPKTQEVRNISGSDVAVGGNQSAVITGKQTVDMQTNQEKCGTGNQLIDGVQDSRVAVAGCEASATAKE
jgi:hypothetical protein